MTHNIGFATIRINRLNIQSLGVHLVLILLILAQFRSGFAFSYNGGVGGIRRGIIPRCDGTGCYQLKFLHTPLPCLYRCSISRRVPSLFSSLSSCLNSNNHDGNALVVNRVRNTSKYPFLNTYGGNFHQSSSLFTKGADYDAASDSVDSAFADNSINNHNNNDKEDEDEDMKDKDKYNNNSNNNNNNNTREEILSLAVPALLSLAVDPLMTLADTAFVGRTSQTPDGLAGMGISSALLTLSLYAFNFLCTATAPLISERRASGDKKGGIEVGGQALSLAILLGGTLGAMLYIFQSPLLDVMGANSAGMGARMYAQQFLSVRAFAPMAVFLISACTGILRGYLDTRTSLVVLVGANVVNLCLDVLFILGLDMGPMGAALATTSAEWIAALAFLGVLGGFLPSAIDNSDLGRKWVTESIITQETTTNDIEDSMNLSPITTTSKNMQIFPLLAIPEWQEVKPLLIASSSIFLRSLTLQLALAGAAAVAARSTLTLSTPNADNSFTVSDSAASAGAAAHQIALQLWLLCSFACDALAAASQALVADRLGRQDPIGVRIISNSVLAYGLVLGCILSLSLQLSRNLHILPELFTHDTDTMLALAPLLTVIIWAQPLNSLVFVADGVLQGASEFAFQAKSMVLSVIVAASSFVLLERTASAASTSTSTDTLFHVSDSMLLHVWLSLIVLQLMRALTSAWKLMDREGPIDLLALKPIP
mmetsp:Transcript_14576/g.20794  ORF Transcript_14576/g.20794 Transcript_14576/m.20794 type:complete len:710 (-) Transcript_14576:77-2206(-)